MIERAIEQANGNYTEAAKLFGSARQPYLPTGPHAESEVETTAPGINCIDNGCPISRASFAREVGIQKASLSTLIPAPETSSPNPAEK